MSVCQVLSNQPVQPFLPPALCLSFALVGCSGKLHREMTMPFIHWLVGGWLEPFLWTGTLLRVPAGVGAGGIQPLVSRWLGRGTLFCGDSGQGVYSADRNPGRSTLGRRKCCSPATPSSCPACGAVTSASPPPVRLLTPNPQNIQNLK